MKLKKRLYIGSLTAILPLTLIVACSSTKNTTTSTEVKSTSIGNSLSSTDFIIGRSLYITVYGYVTISSGRTIYFRDVTSITPSYLGSWI